MYIIAEHEISNPKSFWEIAKRETANLPSNMKVHQILPNKEGTKAVCVWEAAKVDEVKAFVEKSVGHVSRNTYFSIETANAIGLPTLK
jgi:hypothetical protein